MNVLYGKGTWESVALAFFKGATIGILASCLLTLPIAVVLKPIFMLAGIENQSELILEAVENGDPIEIGIRVLQAITMVYGFGSQCFTGETLIETDEGLVAIEDIEVGDYVLAEDTETGEKEYKEVLNVYVSQTNKLIHVNTTDNDSETTINTTDNHPFYVEGKGWVPAIELEAGDVLRTADGSVEIVKDVTIEYLDEAVLIYNLEIEGYHTYFVSDESVLVHNTKKCGSGDTNKDDNGKKPNYQRYVKKGNNQPPDNFSPDGAKRHGSYREAKRASGIPNSEQPIAIIPATDKNGKLIPGKDYIFSGNKIIREHFGHDYPDGPIQNRGRHFNDIYGNHYDY